MENVFAVIMAGGVGSRFWPRSRKALPKQLLNIFGQQSMIQETVARISELIPKERILVITNKVQKALIEEQLGLNSAQIIAEPVGKNTGPCIALAAQWIRKDHPKAVMVVLPADHLIKNQQSFHQALQKAVAFASDSMGLLTFGIQPTLPHTGYGYIHFANTPVKDHIYEVIEFKEKPDSETAKTYLENGSFLWNSGMFVWRVDVILQEMQQLQPELYQHIQNISTDNTWDLHRSLETIYPSLQSISIDYAIMEPSKRVYVMKSDFEWSDVGSWQTVYELSDKDGNGNAIEGDVYIKDTKNSYIHSPQKFTAVLGEQDIVIIDTPDALLVCNRQHDQQIKHVVNYLQERGDSELL
ncbi:NTP transferase domain-containing protein [candidate division KSB1 bacterium]|nr:NTP transferase domain-containing protein [candidate division KSB1 bacterium]